MKFMSDWDVICRYLFLSLLIVPITLLIALVFNIFRDLKYRQHLPLLCGIFLVSLILILNPQQDEGSPFRSLYILKLLSPLFLLPLFILAPMPYIEKWFGKPFRTQAIFFGVFLATLWYCVISQYGRYYIGDPWGAEGLFWTVFTIAPAFLIFLGIYFCQQFLDNGYKHEPSDSPSGAPRVFLIKNRKTIIIILITLLAFGAPLYLLNSLGDTETAGGFNVYSIQESEIGNGSVIHLTEKDFWEFPRIRSLIRDSEYNGCNDDTGNCIAQGSYSFNEQQQMRYYETKILEYQGRFYTIRTTWIT